LELIEALFDLITSNFLFLAVIFGVISFLLNKIRGAGAPNGQPRTNTMPPFGGEGPLGGGMTRGEPAYGSEPMQVPAVTFPQRLEDDAAAPQPLDARSQEAPLARKPGAPLRPSPMPESMDKGAAVNPVALHARNAAQGMIWAEVFGPPRALKPHKRR
jgi:hypothetical protein